MTRLLFALLLAALLAPAQPPAPDHASALTVAGTDTATGLTWPEEVRKQPAGKVLRNVQVMTEIPAERFMAAMASMKASLGVECEHCHNKQLYRSDEKEPKLKAREMLRMAYSINSTHFGGETRLTCYTCHRGSNKPESDVPARAPASAKIPLPHLTAEEGAKPAPEIWKNIKVLTAIPAGRLVRVMGVFTVVLGVECAHCHVEGQWESDEKKPKETARRMLQMVNAVAKDHFEGKGMVACWTCHRGAPEPARSARDAAKPVAER